MMYVWSHTLFDKKSSYQETTIFDRICKASPVYELAKTVCPSVCPSVCLSGVNNLRLAVAFSLVSHKPLMIH